MSKAEGKSDLTQNINPYFNARMGMKFKSVDINSLMKRLRKGEKKVNNEKFIFMMTAISVLIISGIIISF